MAKVRIGIAVLGVLMLWSSLGVGQTTQTPTVEQVLSFRPRQEDVKYSTPAPAELAACRVELIKGVGKSTGWLLRDPRGLPLRRFVDLDGNNTVDVWCYYYNGQECYREIDSNNNQKVDQYRWLGVNGSKWGIDVNEDGKIDAWKQISAEEVSQEILQAIIRQDISRWQALILSESELRSLELPEAEAARIREQLSAAPQKFKQTSAALIKLGPKTQWIHLELAPPECITFDNGKPDLIRHRRGSLLYENGGAHDWIQTGELVQVGKAWRVVDGPTPGARVETAQPENGGIVIDQAIQAEIAELQAIDKDAPKSATGPEVVQYNLKRAAVLEKIAAKTQGQAREQWLRQAIDSLSAAAQSSADRGVYAKLAGLKDSIVKAAPASQLAAYAVYRDISAEYTLTLANPGKEVNLVKMQEAWAEKLKGFVQAYPGGEDTPEAILQLGMVHEFLGKELEAKNWYARLSQQHSTHPLASKGAGAIRRLELEGKTLELSGPTLNGQHFDMNRVRNKVVIVYYWASWNTQAGADFAKLRTLLNTYAPKGVELVCVNLDNAPGDAQAYLSRNPTPGIHLHQPGGLDSPLATQYGVMVLPNLFLVGRDGKVVSRTVQVATLEDEVRKLVN
jgi:hypothetical protein